MKKNSKTSVIPPTPAPAPTKARREFISDAEEIKARALKDKDFLRAVHGQGFSGTVLRAVYESTAGGKLFGETAQDFEIDVIAKMEARHPLEQMLIDQMLWTHIRIGRLSNHGVRQTRS